MEAGRPSELTPEFTLKIRKLVLEGRNYKEIQSILEINPNTWDAWVWKNYKDFRTNLKNWDNEILINIAKTNLHTLLNGEDDKIKADLTKFTLSTLDKVNFSTRQETDVTSGGRPIFMPSEILEKNEIDTRPEPNC